jgi:hypothetical protein
MDDQVVVIYCMCDDLLQALHHREDPRCAMSDAEVMTTALVAARFFGGNHENARALLGNSCYVPHILSKSRLNRRMHRFGHLAEVWKQLNAASIYIIDTFPIPALDNIRISRARLYHDEAFRGYIQSKRCYFYGLRLRLLTTAACEPVEVFLLPGSLSDKEAVKRYTFALSSTMRKKNSTRAVPPWVAYLQFRCKMIETAGSLISQLLPKSIHVVTPQGFELKVFPSSPQHPLCAEGGNLGYIR